MLFSYYDILRDVQVGEVISRLVVSASLNPTRFVDLQLGHWGFSPNPRESFLNMYNRLKNRILAWWTSNDNGVRDNGIGGIARLNTNFSPRVSPSIYYFTMSFDATRPSPQLNLSSEDLEDLPVNPVVSYFGLGYPGLGGVKAKTASLLSFLGHGILALSRETLEILISYNGPLRSSTTTPVHWATRIPSPRGRISRDDMLPILYSLLE
jgi:hypothetical protein